MLHTRNNFKNKKHDKENLMNQKKPLIFLKLFSKNNCNKNNNIMKKSLCEVL